MLYLLLALPFGLNACVKTFHVASHDTFWPPYVVNVNGIAQGKDVVALALIFANSPYCIKVEFLPNTKRAFVEQQKGRMDLGWAASYTEERAKDVYFTQSYRHEVMWLYQLTNNTHAIKNLADMFKQGYSVAVHRGSYYGKEFERFKTTHKNQIVYTSAATQRVELLNKQRVDFIIEDQLVGEYFINHTNNIKQTENIKYINKGSIHLMLSKSTSTLQDVKVINALIENKKARLKALFKSHMAVDFTANKSQHRH
jgi:polar amino acid transport system substrate-binding protein